MKNGQPEFSDAAKFIGLGLEIAVVFCAPVLAGYWLDGRYGSRPWGVLVGALLGAAGAGRLLLGVVRSVGKGE